VYDATEVEYRRCAEIVKRLTNKNNDMTDETIDILAREILSISYSIGGSYEEDIVSKIALLYLGRQGLLR
jgi:hypothetical protein